MADLALDSSEQEALYDDIAERVRELWQQALAEVMAKVEDAEAELGDGYTVERLNAIEDEIRATIDGYRDAYLAILREGIEAEIERAGGDMDAFFEHAGILNQFATISEDLVDAVISEMEKGVDGTIDRAGRIGTLWTEELRRIQLESLMLSNLEGEGLPERKERILAAIREGKAKVPDGWKGSVESYAEMVARTNMAEAARATTLARGVAAGIDVYQVSVHGAADACGAFEGRLYGRVGNEEGVSGSVADVLGARPWIWHPNCRHQLLPYIDELASDERKRAMETASGPMPSEEELKAMNREAAKLRAQGTEKLNEREKDNSRTRS